MRDLPAGNPHCQRPTVCMCGHCWQSAHVWPADWNIICEVTMDRDAVVKPLTTHSQSQPLHAGLVLGFLVWWAEVQAAACTLILETSKHSGPASSSVCIALLHYCTCGLKVTLLISPECAEWWPYSCHFIVLYTLRPTAMRTETLAKHLHTSTPHTQMQASLLPAALCPGATPPPQVATLPLEGRYRGRSVFQMKQFQKQTADRCPPCRAVQRWRLQICCHWRQKQHPALRPCGQSSLTDTVHCVHPRAGRCCRWSRSVPSRLHRTRRIAGDGAHQARGSGASQRQ